MKPIDKKEMPKLIVLIVLAVGLLGFAVYQFTGGAAAGNAGITQKSVANPARSAEAARQRR